jgi:hypothetical protein
MQSSSAPTKFPIPWANAAQSQFIRNIPVASQIGIQDGAASLTDGFVPDNFTQLAAGGIPPFGQDFNGILKQMTQWLQWTQAGGAVPYDAAFSSAIGGYPGNALVESAIVPGRLWLSTMENNTNNPDEYPFTGWVTPPGMLPPGTPFPSFQSVVLPNCVLANGGTIGNAGSGGTSPPNVLASPTAFFLFCSLWLQFSQAQCPVMFNGVAVARGATPFADWTAGRVIQTPEMNGAGIIGQDNMGGNPSNFLSGVPVVNGAATAPAAVIGEVFHTNTLAETPTGITSNNTNQSISVASVQTNITLAGNFATFQGGSNGSIFEGFTNGGVNAGGVTSTGSNSISVTSNNTGGGGHNNVQRSFTVAWNLTL